MDFKIAYQKLDASEALSEFVRIECEKVTEGVPGTSRCSVHISKNREQIKTVIECATSWGRFTATGSDVDFHPSCVAAIEKLEKQILREKEKTKDHLRTERTKPHHHKKMHKRIDNPPLRKSA